MSLSEKLEAARLALGKRKERERQQQAADSKAEQLLGPRGDNRLLAGNLAHEFLTRGTLLGRRIGPDKEEEEEESVGRRRYAEVSLLLMASGGAGAHVPGVVNPTQLASWLRIKGVRTREERIILSQFDLAPSPSPSRFLI